MAWSSPWATPRPAWKVLRVLGNMLNLPGFDFETSEDVRGEALGDASTVAARLDNRVDVAIKLDASASGLERLADVPIYAVDPMVRRAVSLQLTADARAPVASLPAAVWERLGLSEGSSVRVSQGMAAAVLPATLDRTLASNTVRVPAGTAQTRTLGPMFGPISIDKA